MTGMKLDQILFLLLFGAFAVGVWFIVKWGGEQWGWWFFAPWIAACFLIAWIIDRRKKRSSGEP